MAHGIKYRAGFLIPHYIELGKNILKGPINHMGLGLEFGQFPDIEIYGVPHTARPINPDKIRKVQIAIVCWVQYAHLMNARHLTMLICINITKKVGSFMDPTRFV